MDRSAAPIGMHTCACILMVADAPCRDLESADEATCRQQDRQRVHLCYYSFAAASFCEDLTTCDATAWPC